MFEKPHEKPDSRVFDYESFNLSVEEIVQEDEMDRLLAFSNGTYPPWGENIKELNEYKKVRN